ncbi:MAG: hypothetical protein ABL904_18130 [Hyphomicrobiaceae bacterium]
MRGNRSFWRSRGRAFGFGLLVLVAVPAGAPLARNAFAQEAPASKLSLLSPEQRRTHDAWKAARTAFEAEYDGYWNAVNGRRDERKRKRAAGKPFTAADYVLTQPPKYTGPVLPDAIAKILADDTPPVPETPRPMLGDFLQAARDAYNFMPEVTTEEDFKRRYATEALAIGLTKDQVVKVYALETGGMGTYDMQAGIHPQKRTGKAISSALGYAQLLHANSVSELVKHGESFIRRLEAMAVTEKGAPPWRPASLRTKAAILRAMLKDARTVPNEWSAHVKFGGTQKGLAMHALNLDADIGPWLQVIKLKGLKETAALEAGRTTLSGPEIELMNLAGPRTGLEMLMPVAHDVPTTNFFSRQGYERNTVVRERTAAELLVELGKRMELGLVKPGAIEFAAAFDAVGKR